METDQWTWQHLGARAGVFKDKALPGLCSYLPCSCEYQLIPLNSKFVCKARQWHLPGCALLWELSQDEEATDVPKSTAVMSVLGTLICGPEVTENTGVLEREPTSKRTSQDAALWLPRPPTPYHHEGELLRAFQPKRENKHILEISRGKHSQSLEFPCIGQTVPRREAGQ